MARKYLDTTGLTALWAKIKGLFNSLATVATTGSYNDLTNKPTVAEIDDSSTANDKAWSAFKIGTDLDGKVSKSGDTMTGTLTMAGTELHLKTTDSSSNDSGDIVWFYGNDQEKARIWADDSPTTADGGRLNFRCYKSDGTALSSGKLATSSDIDGKVSKSGDTMSGRLTVKGDAGGSWVSSQDVDQAAIKVDGTATNGQRYDTIISNKCYNGSTITIGRITDQLCFGYVKAGQTDNSLMKFMNFEPANGNGKVTFGTNGAAKSYIDLSDGYYSGKAANATLWNGVTDDHSTNNTTDTWVPVYTGSKIQHRAIPTAYNNAPWSASSVVSLNGYSNTTVASTQFLAYWNGAYNSSGSSNLSRCNKGAFGTIVTHNMTNPANISGAGIDGQDRIMCVDQDGTTLLSSTFRSKHMSWGTSATIYCRRSTSALGIVMCNTGSNTEVWHIMCNGAPSSWKTRRIDSASNVYIAGMTAGTITKGGVDYAILYVQSSSNFTMSAWYVSGDRNNP